MGVHVASRESPEQPPAAPSDGTPDEAPPAAAPEPGDSGFDAADQLNRLSKVVLAAVPALTVALAAVGSATGGLARLFRDQTTVARLAIALIFLSFLLAALASRTAAGSGLLSGRPGVRVVLLLLSTAAFITGAAWAFDAQIAVMGTGEAPVVTGTVTPSATGSTLDARVLASGIKADRRIVVFAFESSDDHGDVASRKVPLYYSKSGPDADGKVDMHLAVAVPGADLQQYPYVFVTAVLGEEQRDCDGVLLEGHGPPAPTATACLTVERPGAATATPPPTAPAAAPTSARTVDVPGTVAWDRTGVRLTKGQQVTIDATGSVSYAGGTPPVGPDGAADPHPGVCVLPGADHHAGLIARIGPTGTPFLVGRHFSGAAPATGELELGINDTGTENNAGSYRATVEAAQA
jgi:hypothetical protein